MKMNRAGSGVRQPKGWGGDRWRRSVGSRTPDRSHGGALLLSAAWCLLFHAACAPSPGPVRPGGQPPGPATSEGPTLPRAEGLEDAEFAFTVVADSIPDDPAMEGLVAPFRERMGEEVRQVIGTSEVLLAKSVPEGTLGNFATDAMLWAARRASGGPVDMAMTNNGGLRVPIPPGPITIGQMFELMPFENLLSVLTLSGRQVQELADQLAAFRGEPIAGFSFRIEADGESRVARGIMAASPETPLSKSWLPMVATS